MLWVQILSACFKRREVTLPRLDFILINLEQGSQLFYLLLVAVVDAADNEIDCQAQNGSHQKMTGVAIACKIADQET